MRYSDTRVALRLSFLVFCIAAFGLAPAGTVSLSWNPAVNADGYRVYYGTAPGQYAFSRDIGNNTSAAINGLQDCTEWFFAVKAYNLTGESVGFSGELSGWPRPTIDVPIVRRQGEQFTMTIRGSNFQPGLSVTTNNSNVTLGAPSVTACDTVELVATIEPTIPGVRPAEIGTWALEVVNPSTVFGSRSDGLQVLIEPLRFDVYNGAGPSQGRLDARDAITLSRPFGSREGDVLYNPDTDFNGDGWIDGQDLAYLASNLGGCWSSQLADWDVNSCPEGLR